MRHCRIAVLCTYACNNSKLDTNMWYFDKLYGRTNRLAQIRDDNKRVQPNHISLRAVKKEVLRLLATHIFPWVHSGALFSAYTMIIYLSNKIKSGLYRIYSTYMLEANPHQSGYFDYRLHNGECVIKLHFRL